MEVPRCLQIQCCKLVFLHLSSTLYLASQKIRMQIHIRFLSSFFSRINALNSLMVSRHRWDGHHLKGPCINNWHKDETLFRGLCFDLNLQHSFQLFKTLIQARCTFLTFFWFNQNKIKSMRNNLWTVLWSTV